MGTLAEARDLVVRTDERMWEAELGRIGGESRRLQGASIRVTEGYFRRVLTVAHGQSPKPFELRVSISLARLWRDQGKHAEARDLLASVYGGFTEGFDTADLKEAKALFDELNGLPEPRTT